jgi:membrane protein YdbS with pleckstrin-like domain
MNYILSAKKGPFADYDAAAAKAEIMTEEVGVRYVATEYPDGGYAVIRHDNATERKSENEDFTLDLNRDQGTTGLPHFYEGESDSNDPFNFGNSEPAHAMSGKPLMEDQGISERNRESRREQPVEKSTENRQKEHIENDTDWDKRFPEIKLHPSWASFIAEYNWIFVGFIIAMFPELLWGWFLTYEDVTEGELLYRIIPGTIVLSAVALVLYNSIRIILYWWAHKYVVGNRQVESHYGIIFRKQASIAVKDIRTVDLNQGIAGRILRFGSLALATAGTSGNDIEIINIKEPLKLKNIITQRREAAAHYLEDNND